MEANPSEPLCSVARASPGSPARERFESSSEGSNGGSESISSDSVSRRERRTFAADAHSQPAVDHSEPYSPSLLPRRFTSAPVLSLFDIVEADPYDDGR